MEHTLGGGAVDALLGGPEGGVLGGGVAGGLGGRLDAGLQLGANRLAASVALHVLAIALDLGGDVGHGYTTVSMRGNTKRLAGPGGS